MLPFPVDRLDAFLGELHEIMLVLMRKGNSPETPAFRDLELFRRFYRTWEDILCARARPDHGNPVLRARQEDMRNRLKSIQMVARKNRILACVNGHAFTPENTYTTTGGMRRCKTCVTASGARHRQREKQKQARILAAGEGPVVPGPDKVSWKFRILKCVNGHAFTSDSRITAGIRYCRICARAASKRAYERRRLLLDDPVIPAGLASP